MKFKKVIITLIVASLMLSSLPTAKRTVLADYSPRDIDFHWAENDITDLVNAGILRGNQDYTNPDSNITRGEFAALTARTLGLKGGNNTFFTDIQKGHMFHSEIGALYQEGLINGVGGGIFDSKRTVTREEIMLIVSRTLSEARGKKVNFKDIKNNYKYLKELEIALGSGIITGFSDNTFRPHLNATRSECAVILKRLLQAQKSISKSEVLKITEEYIQNDKKDTEKNLDITLGRAKSEIELKLDAKAQVEKNLAQIEKVFDNLTVTDYTSKGALASVTYEGDAEYFVTTKDNSRHRDYYVAYKFDIINTNNKLYIYDANMSLKKKEKINLTWDVTSTPPDYAPEGVNVISPSSFQISKENLGVESRDLFGGIKFYNSLTRKYVNYAKSNGYEVWPIYKTDFSLKTSNDFLNSPTARKKAIEYLIDYSLKYLIDGINIDFENIYSSNRYLLTKHTRELSVMLHELGLIVSCDITRLEPTSANWSMCYDRNVLSENCDYVMLMAYDEYYASSPTAGSVASLDWTEESVKRTLEEIPAHKLVLGIPFYMRYFEVVGNKVTASKAIGMSTAYDLIQKNNPKYTYMESDGQYKISWKDGKKTCVFWLESTDTISKRMDILNKYNLAGVASWRRGLEISRVWETISSKL